MPCSSAPGLPRCRLRSLILPEDHRWRPWPWRLCRSLLPSESSARCTICWMPSPRRSRRASARWWSTSRPSTPTGTTSRWAAASACSTCTAGSTARWGSTTSRWARSCALSQGPGWCVTRPWVQGGGCFRATSEAWPECPPREHLTAALQVECN